MNYLADKPRKKELTEKQQTFLDNVVVTGGDLKKAAELAGYKGNHYQVIQSLKDELVDMAQNLLAHNAPRAAMKLVEVMDSDRPVPQASSKLQAAQTILDRVGVAKRDRLDVTHKAAGGIFILPEKAPIEVEAEDVEYEE